MPGPAANTLHPCIPFPVHYQQSMMLTRALEEADVLFQQLSYPDENHGIVQLRPHFYHSLSNFILNTCFGRNEALRK